MTDDGVQSASGTEQFVVYLDDDLHWIETHGGPYIPSKAREVREAMERHLANGNYRDWSIPEDAEKVETVTKEELSELKEISLRADGGTERNPLVARLVAKDWIRDQGEDSNHAKVSCDFCEHEHLGELFQSPPDGFYVRYYCAREARQGRRSFP